MPAFLEIESDGVLVERRSVVASSGGQDQTGMAPNRLSIMLEKFDSTTGAPTTQHLADYVYGGLTPIGGDHPRVFNFCLALTLILAGRKLARVDPAWCEGFKFVYFVQGSRFQVNRAPLLGIYPEGTEIKYMPHMDVCYCTGLCGVWTPTQEDILAEDWHQVGVDGLPV